MARSTRLAALLALAPLCVLPASAQAPGKPPPAGAPTLPAPAPGVIPGKPGPATAAPAPPAAEPRTTPPPAQAAIPNKPPPLRPGEAPPSARQMSSGTAFVVAERRLLTNHHVVEGCTTIRVRTASGTQLPATVQVTDAERDLAILVVQGDPGPVLPFRSGPVLRRGEAVLTYGFPLAGLLSSGPTLTTGDISALAGMSDNQRQVQISAPVQPGNSGGPLLDLGGNVVGVVVSKLNAQRVAQRTGDIPQNVNFAVRGQEAIDFLRRNGVTPRLAETGAMRNAAEVGEVAHPSTLYLGCSR